MASQKALDRVICFIGILAGIAGIAFTIYIYLVLGSMIDAIHASAISQADSAISLLQDAGGVVSSAAGTMDSLTLFAKNASSSLNQTADSIGSTGTAIGALASAISSIPYLPSQATAPLHSASSELQGTATSMRETASSMAGASDEALSAASGVKGLEDDIEESIAGLEETKGQLDAMHQTARLGLFLGTALAALTFCLNALTFYRQLG